jgi:hypothetical protein
VFLEIRDGRGYGESRMLTGLIHCERVGCQHKAGNLAEGLV